MEVIPSSDISGHVIQRYSIDGANETYELHMGEEVGSWSKVMFEDEDVIVDYTIESATNQVEFTDLNLTKKYIYDIWIEGSTTESTDVHCTFNDVNTSYWQMGYYSSTTLTANSSFEYTKGVRANGTDWYFGHGLRPEPSTIEGQLTFIPRSNGNYCPRYSWESKCIWQGYQFDTKAFGVTGQAPNAITKLTYKTHTGNFNSGTRFIIRKRKK